MADDKIAYMANQIATAFRTRSDPEAAFADHINTFWEPRMRAQLLARLARGEAGLSPVVTAAAPAIRPPGGARATRSP